MFNQPIEKKWGMSHEDEQYNGTDNSETKNHLKWSSYIPKGKATWNLIVCYNTTC